MMKLASLRLFLLISLVFSVACQRASQSLPSDNLNIRITQQPGQNPSVGGPAPQPVPTDGDGVDVLEGAQARQQRCLAQGGLWQDNECFDQNDEQVNPEVNPEIVRCHESDGVWENERCQFCMPDSHADIVLDLCIHDEQQGPSYTYNGALLDGLGAYIGENAGQIDNDINVGDPSRGNSVGDIGRHAGANVGNDGSQAQEDLAVPGDQLQNFSVQFDESNDNFRRNGVIRIDLHLQQTSEAFLYAPGSFFTREQMVAQLARHQGAGVFDRIVPFAQGRHLWGNGRDVDDMINRQMHGLDLNREFVSLEIGHNSLNNCAERDFGVKACRELDLSLVNGELNKSLYVLSNGRDMPVSLFSYITDQSRMARTKNYHFQHEFPAGLRVQFGSQQATLSIQLSREVRDYVLTSNAVSLNECQACQQLRGRQQCVGAMQAHNDDGFILRGNVYEEVARGRGDVEITCPYSGVNPSVQLKYHRAYDGHEFNIVRRAQPQTSELLLTLQLDADEDHTREGEDGLLKKRATFSWQYSQRVGGQEILPYREIRISPAPSAVPHNSQRCFAELLSAAEDRRSGSWRFSNVGMECHAFIVEVRTVEQPYGWTRLGSYEVLDGPGQRWLVNKIAPAGVHVQTLQDHFRALDYSGASPDVWRALETVAGAVSLSGSDEAGEFFQSMDIVVPVSLQLRADWAQVYQCREVDWNGDNVWSVGPLENNWDILLQNVHSMSVRCEERLGIPLVRPAAGIGGGFKYVLPLVTTLTSRHPDRVWNRMADIEQIIIDQEFATFNLSMELPVVPLGLAHYGSPVKHPATGCWLDVMGMGGARVANIPLFTGCYISCRQWVRETESEDYVTCD